MAEDLYRVVVDDVGRRRGVASSPMSQADAEAGLPTVLDVFAADIAAGDIHVGVIAETEFARRWSVQDDGHKHKHYAVVVRAFEEGRS